MGAFLYIFFNYFLIILFFLVVVGGSQTKSVCQTIKWGKIQKCNDLQNIEHLV